MSDQSQPICNTSYSHRHLVEDQQYTSIHKNLNKLQKQFTLLQYCRDKICFTFSITCIADLSVAQISGIVIGIIVVVSLVAFAMYRLGMVKGHDNATNKWSGAALCAGYKSQVDEDFEV